jgi:hypothetical protein
MLGLIRAVAETLRRRTEEAEALRLVLAKAVMPPELKTAFDVFGSELPDEAFASVFNQPRQRDWAWYPAEAADGPQAKESR